MRTTLRSFALLALLVPAAAQAAAPANDKFEKATLLTPGAAMLLNQNGSTSTPDALDPYIDGAKLTRSVWYRFDVDPTVLNVRVIINDHAGVRAAVFELDEVDGNAGTLKFRTQTSNTTANDVETLSATVNFNRHFYVCVESKGLFDLKVQAPLQINDYFVDAIALAGDEGTVTGSNIGAINTGDQPAVLPAKVPGQGVWYTWTPSFNGNAVLDTNFSEHSPKAPFDTIIAVFTGTALETLQEVGSDDDGGYSSNSRLVFAASAGTTYHIWVGGYETNEGPFFLSYCKATSAGVFEISNVTNYLSEQQGATSFRVRRFRAGNVAANVTIASSNGSATAGSDYAVINSVLVFTDPVGGDLDGNWGQDVPVTILPDSFTESDEFFNLALLNPTAGATLGANSANSITIQSTLTNSAPSFNIGVMRVKETDGSVLIPLSRTNSSGMVTVRVVSNARSDATATGNVDYDTMNTSVFMAPGQTQAFVTLTLRNDGWFEGNETIHLEIQTETYGLAGPVAPVMTITVEDDDLPVPSAGRLSGFLDNNGITGNVDINITAGGVVTGKVVLVKGSLPFKGTLVNGQLTVRLGTATSPLRTLTIRLLNAASKTYQVTLNDGERGTTATGTLAATNYSKLTPCPVMGRYTFADSNGGGGVPQLFASTIMVDASGTATLSGKLYDGTAVVAAGAVDPGNKAFIGASLFASKGRVTVVTLLSTVVQTITAGNLYVVRPGRSNQTVELPSLLVSGTAAQAARYVPPAVGQRALANWNVAGNGSADMTGGGFAMLTTKTFTITTANKINMNAQTAEQLKLTVTPSTGVFTGTVIPTGATKPKAIYGVLLQGTSVTARGHGFFLNGIVPGKVLLK